MKVHEGQSGGEHRATPEHGSSLKARVDVLSGEIDTGKGAFLQWYWWRFLTAFGYMMSLTARERHLPHFANATFLQSLEISPSTDQSKDGNSVGLASPCIWFTNTDEWAKSRITSKSPDLEISCNVNCAGERYTKRSFPEVSIARMPRAMPFSAAVNQTSFPPGDHARPAMML